MIMKERNNQRKKIFLGNAEMGYEILLAQESNCTYSLNGPLIIPLNFPRYHN